MSVISVVIPTYNNAHLIGDALESVFKQSFRDYEIIVVDDGSTDHTRELLKPYTERITYYHQENQGLAVARNTGLRLAGGEYITYLDADDIWHPENLRVKADILKRFPGLGGVFSDFLIFDASGVRDPRGTKKLFPFFRRTGRDFKDIFQHTDTVQVEPGRSAIVHHGQVFDSLFWGNFILPTSMVFNRSFAQAVGEFRPHMRTQQDYEYWLRFSKSYPLAYVDDVLVSYRRHPQQLTDHSKIERMLLAIREIIDLYEEEFRHAGKSSLYNRRKAEILTNLAKVYIRQGKTSKARKLVYEALQRDPRFWAAYLHYALSFAPYHWVAGIRTLLR